MTNHTILEPLPEDQWFIESQELRSFVTKVQEISASTIDDHTQTLTKLEPYFQELLAQQECIPEKFAQVNPESQMDGGISQWLLYRAKDRSLSVFSLVILSGSTTPVHDHLAWGLIGLYKGNQEETLYRRVDNGDAEGHAQLQVTEVRSLQPGDIYHLLPPDNDIHSVKAISQSPSVSIHLMSNDTGSVLHHQFIPESQSVKSFRSGYSNAPYKEDKKEYAQLR